MAKIKSEKQIESIRIACRMVANLMNEISERVVPGASTWDLNQFADAWMKERHVRPSFMGWRGYEYATCMSVNECVIHGIPNKKPLQEGDIVGVDMGIIYDSAFSDHAKTFAVGNVKPEIAKLLDVTKESLQAAIDALGPGKRVGEVGKVVETMVRPHRYGIIREYCGHGVGESVWEDPQIPNYVGTTMGPRLKRNMVVAIEPMLNLGTAEIEHLDDGWSVVTADRKPGAHFEHTVLITDRGSEILTLPDPA